MNEIIGFAAVIVSIFAGMLFNNSRFNTIEGRFSSIDTRLDRMQSETNDKFNRMQSETNDKFDRMQSEINGRLDRMQSDLSVFYRDLGRHDAKIESLEKKAS
jgi:hypothetical protein